MMQPFQNSSESAIINIAINIFQNVGIRRWIEQIEILKNQQIYFEICKIIFPETMIHIFRLSENKNLSTGKKIQGVIDLIAKIINNDLSHISGEAIANGKIIHLKNFLQLLEALSNSMITKEKIQVESEPPNDQSITYNEHNKSYYTVIGMEHQFGYPTCFEGGEQPGNDPNETDHGSQSPENSNGSTSTEPVPPFPPGYDVNYGSHQEPANNGQKERTPPFTSSSRRKKPLTYPQPLEQRNQVQFEEQHGKWVKLIKDINLSKLNLEKERMNQTKESFLRWKANHDFQNKRVKQQFEADRQKRNNFLKNKMNYREALVNSLRGEKQAEQVIKKLFQQEKAHAAHKKQQKKARQEENIKKITNFQELNQLLSKALMSNKPEQLFREE